MSTYDPDQSAPVSIAVAGRLAVTAGETSALPVEITNRLGEPIVLVVRAVGAEVGPPIRTVPVGPGDTVALSLAVSVPVGFPGREQSAAVEVLAHRAADPSGPSLGRTLAPVTLVLDEGSDLRARLQPAEVRGAHKAGLTVELENRGTAPIEVHLGRSGDVSVELEPDRLVLPPGARRRVPATVRRTRPLMGSTRRTPFGIVVSSRQRDLRLPGGLTQSPVLSRGLTGIVAIFAVIAVWAAALTVGLDKVGVGSDDKDKEQAQAAAQAAEAAAEAANGAGSGQGAEGSKVSVGEAGEDAAAAGVRVGGTVTAADAGGVDVSIRPVSLSDPETDGATFAQPLKGPGRSVGPAKRLGRPVGLTAPTLDERRSTTTDVDGAWAFGGMRAPGLYLVTFAKAGYQTERYIVETTEGEEPPALDISLEAGPGSITGRVTTESGEGAGSVTISATDGNVVLTTTTASDGNVGAFSLQGLSTPATWVLTTSRAGYGAETARVDLGGSGSADGVAIIVSTGVAAISGTVTSAEGAVGGLTVSVTDGEITRTATTLTEGPTGGFVIPALPIPGVYTLSIEGDGWQALTREVDLKADASLNLEMRRSTAQLVGTIVDSSTRVGIGGAGITLVSDGQTFKSGSAGDGDGRFELSGVPPGSYVVTFERYGFASEQVLVQLDAGDRKDLGEIAMVVVPPETLPEESTISGVVTATTGGAIAGADIAVLVSTSAKDGIVVPTKTDDKGSYLIEGLPPGIHTVTASASGYASSTRSARVAVGGAITVDFALIPNAEVTGRVISNFDQVAKAGATVEITKPGDATFVARHATTGPKADGSVGFTFTGVDSLETGTYEIAVTELADHQPSAKKTFDVTAPTDVVVDLNVDRYGHLLVQVVKPAQGGLTLVSGAKLTVTGPGGGDVCTNIIPFDSARTCPVETEAKVIELAGLAPGSYTASAPAVAGSQAGSSGAVGVALNRTDTATVVLAPQPGSVSGQVVWSNSGTTPGVPKPTVTLSTIVGYSSTSGWVSTTCTTVGDESGNFGFTFPDTTGQCEPVVAEINFGFPVFLDGSFQASAANFTTGTSEYRSWASGAAVELTLKPTAGTLGGTVSLIEDEALTQGTSKTGITAKVETKPAGSGSVVVTVSGSGAISATEDGRSTISPGPYSITFSKGGYDADTVTVEVPPGQKGTASPTLVRQGSVRVNAVSRPDPDLPANSTNNLQKALNGVTFRLTDASGNVRELIASSTADGVTFPNISHGDYTVTAIRAGYDAPSAPLAVHVDIGEADSNNVLVFRRYGSISGTLYGRTGDGRQELDGVTITATGPGADVTQTKAVTGAKGEFTIEHLKSGLYRLTTTGLSGWVDLNVTKEVTNAEGNAIGDLEVAATPATLGGTIVDDATGAAIVGAKVEIYRQVSGIRVTKTKTTDGDGKYSFSEADAVTAAIWKVSVAKTGYGPINTEVDLVSNRHFTLNLEMALLQNTILGDVVGVFGTKKPALTDVDVVVTDVATKAEVATDTTDANGGYRIDGLVDGSYEVSFSKEGFQPAKTATPVDAKGGVTRRADAELAAIRHKVVVTVESAVKDGAGQPIPIDNAPVTLVADSGTADTGATVGPANTAPSGVVSFSNVLPGDYTVKVDAAAPHLAGPTGQALTVQISSSTADIPKTVVVREAKITGTVTYDQGSGPADSDSATVKVFVGSDADVDRDTPVGTLNVVSGSYEGYFAAGTYTVQIIEGAGALTAEKVVTVKSGDTATFGYDFQAAGSLTVTVQDSSGSIVNNATVVVKDAAGHEVGRLTSGQAGDYAFPNLVPGAYSVTATAKDGTKSGTKTVAPGTEATLLLELPAPPTTTTTATTVP